MEELGSDVENPGMLGGVCQDLQNLLQYGSARGDIIRLRDVGDYPPD